MAAAEAAERGEAAPPFEAAGVAADARGAPAALVPPAVDPPAWGAEAAGDPGVLGAPGVAATASAPGVAAAGVVAALPFESTAAAGALDGAAP